eukprot:scaffold16194_cov66-Phaeocystis_antarctica.AAC.2
MASSRQELYTRGDARPRGEHATQTARSARAARSPQPGCSAKHLRAAIAANAVCLARCERASRGGASTSGTQLSRRELCQLFGLAGSAGCTCW